MPGDPCVHRLEFPVTVARETCSPSSRQPSFVRGFGDPCGEAMADDNQTGPLRGIDVEQRASLAGHLVDAPCPVLTRPRIHWVVMGARAAAAPVPVQGNGLTIGPLPASRWKS